jgi:hypothetical protein
VAQPATAAEDDPRGSLRKEVAETMGRFFEILNTPTAVLVVLVASVGLNSLIYLGHRPPRGPSLRPPSAAVDPRGPSKRRSRLPLPASRRASKVARVPRPRSRVPFPPGRVLPRARPRAPLPPRRLARRTSGRRPGVANVGVVPAGSAIETPGAGRGWGSPIRASRGVARGFAVAHEGPAFASIWASSPPTKRERKRAEEQGMGTHLE